MNKIKKYDNILLWIAIAIFSGILTFGTHITVGDELWNFQNLYKMVNGFQIYTDANVIITPIFYWIGAGILKLFGANYFIYRLYNVVIYSSMIVIIYNIFQQLKTEKKLSLLYTLIINIIMYVTIQAGANYNMMAMLFVLLGVYVSLKQFETKRFNIFNILNGSIMYLILFTKQNIGVYYFIGTIIMQLIINGRNKKTYMDLIKQTGVAFILSIITLGIFFIQGNLYEFINYTLLGIAEFSYKNIAIELIHISYIFISMITIVFSFVLRKKVEKTKQKNIDILLSLGVIMLITIYPIVNIYHLLISNIILYILLFYIINLLIKEIISKKVTRISLLVTVFITILSIVFPMINIINSQYAFSNNDKHPYYGAIVNQEAKDKIEKINTYITINSEKVIILSQDAALYNVPEKRNNGRMDLPFLGNLGYGGEDQLIEEIENKKGYQILIKEPLFWQESKKTIEYIKENYTHIGEIEEFQIYEIK